ncbi:MAG: type II secretion system F family protein, partial [Gammaproteobacteria bacterium]|nr:type II secretion system F family protein [Gammaproteobacteria bacterium]
MPLMQYKAMDARGRMTNGQIDAANVADLEMRLERMGLDLVNFQEAKIRAASAGSASIRRRELINFCFQLEQLLSSGVPVVEGLGDLRDSVDDKRLKEVIAGLVESIEGGRTLSEALAEYPSVFDAVFVNLIRAGELSGQVSVVLKSITENLKWQDEQAEQVKKLMMYPTFVGVAVMMALIFLMVYLVPQLVGFVKNMGQELPFHTRALIGLSNLIRDWWYLFLIVPVLVLIAITALVRASPAFAFTVDSLKLRVPLFGTLIKKIMLARFANYFALLYASGITVLECIRICEGLVGNKAVAEATRRAGRQIADGASISAGFEFSGLFPPLVVR